MALTYLLDTNVLAEPVRKIPHAQIVNRIQTNAGGIAIAATTWHEMLFGVFRMPTSHRPLPNVFIIPPTSPPAPANYAAKSNGKTRPAARDVARYLDEEAELDVNFLLLQHTQPDKLLSPDEKWNDYITAFAQTIDNIKHAFSGARLHFFLAAPGALIFGLGCIWGTVDEAQVYHYQSGTYYPVLAITRDLRR